VGIYQDGDVAVLEAVFEGTHTGALNVPEQSPLEATNQKVSIPFTQVHTVRNGKVKSLTGYFDSAALMSQLGVGG
jgi:ketosteroid isomerase-like protein